MSLWKNCSLHGRGKLETLALGSTVYCSNAGLCKQAFLRYCRSGCHVLPSGVLGSSWTNFAHGTAWVPKHPLAVSSVPRLVHCQDQLSGSYQGRQKPPDPLSSYRTVQDTVDVVSHGVVRPLWRRNADQGRTPHQVGPPTPQTFQTDYPGNTNSCSFHAELGSEMRLCSAGPPRDLGKRSDSEPRKNTKIRHYPNRFTLDWFDSEKSDQTTVEIGWREKSISLKTTQESRSMLDSPLITPRRPILLSKYHNPKTT